MKSCVLASYAVTGLLATGCQTDGRAFARLEAEAAAHPAQTSAQLRPLGAEQPPRERNQLVGTWECRYQNDVLLYSTSSISPEASVTHFRRVMTFNADGVYFEQFYNGEEKAADTHGTWQYESGVLTLMIEGDTRREYETIWRGNDLWERRWYPSSAGIDWWRAFYEREEPGFICTTTGGYRPDGCMRILHKRHRNGFGVVEDSISSPHLYKRIKEGTSK